MSLPMPLVRFRSALAQGMGCVLRCGRPVTRRMARFVFEVWARSLIRGTVEPGVQFIGFITVAGSGNVHIGTGTRLGRRAFLETHEDGVIRIGRHCTINDGTTIVSYAEVSIGDYALVGEYATIRDADHGTSLDGPIRFQPHRSSAVRVGEDAWIGRGACVLKGVEVGDGAVVGANSVVTKDVDPQVVAAGAPAKAIGVRRK